MEANELRIGNLVQSNASNCLYRKGTVKIDLETFNKIHHYDGMRSLEPILLTEEWLLKAGFKKVIGYEYDEGWYDISVGKNKTLAYNIKSKKFIIGNNTDNNWTHQFINTKHVHQLQNLYFALKQKELTFK